jgi:hypothetical protein
MISKRFLVLCITLSGGFIGCATDRTNHLSSDQIELLREAKKNSALDEFQKNLAAGHIVIYGYGNLSYGYQIPGLSTSDIEKYIKTNRIPVIIRFVDDPEPLGSSTEYWTEVINFLKKYNKLMINHIKMNPQAKP